MSIDVSLDEARERIDELVGRVVAEGDEVFIADGDRRAVLISADEFEALQATRLREARRAGLERLEALREEVRAQNQDLTEEEADAIADELGRAVIEGLIKRGNVTFVRETP